MASRRFLLCSGTSNRVSVQGLQAQWRIILVQTGSSEGGHSQTGTPVRDEIEGNISYKGNQPEPLKGIGVIYQSVCITYITHKIPTQYKKRFTTSYLGRSSAPSVFPSCLCTWMAFYQKCLAFASHTCLMAMACISSRT